MGAGFALEGIKKEFDFFAGVACGGPLDEGTLSEEGGTLSEGGLYGAGAGAGVGVTVVAGEGCE